MSTANGFRQTSEDWQWFVGSSGWIRKNCHGALGGEQEQVLADIESDLERMRWQPSQPPAAYCTARQAPAMAVPAPAKPVGEPKEKAVN